MSYHTTVLADILKSAKQQSPNPAAPSAPDTVWNVCRYGTERLFLAPFIGREPEDAALRSRWALPEDEGIPLWPIWGATPAERLENRRELFLRFAERYYYNEIAAETVDSFKFAVWGRLCELMPYYTKVGNAIPKELGYDFETWHEDSGSSSGTSESSGTRSGTTTGTTSGETSSTNAAHTGSSSKASTAAESYNSDFPQGNASGLRDDPRYLSGSSQSEGESNGSAQSDTTGSTTGSTSGTSSGTTQDTTRSSGSTSGETHASGHTWGRNSSEVRHWQEYKAACVDLIREIVSALSDLFQISYGEDPAPALWPNPLDNMWPGSTLTGGIGWAESGGAGKDGKDGKDGVGVANAEIVDGHLWLILTDSRRVDCGSFPGMTPEQVAELASKTEKHLLTLSGSIIMDGSTVCTHEYLYHLLMETPAFVVLVFGTKAFHPNTVTSAQIVFDATAVDNGVISVTQIAISAANRVTTVSGTAEKSSNRVNVITSPGSASTYPSTKAVVDYVAGVVGALEIAANEILATQADTLEVL